MSIVLSNCVGQAECLAFSTCCSPVKSRRIGAVERAGTSSGCRARLTLSGRSNMNRTAGWLAVFLMVAVPAQARVTRIDILRTEQFAGGAAFGTVGAYEKVVGRFHGELDPAAP